jgi:hypothetical protein
MICLLSLLAETAHAQIRLGVTGGFDISGVSLTNSGSFGGGTATNYHIRMSNDGFYVGIVADYRLGPSFVIRPSLCWLQAGWNAGVLFGDNGIVGWTEKYRINYLQLPIPVFYTTPVGGGKMYIGGGPYIARAINGRFSDGLNPAAGAVIGGADYFHDIVVGGDEDNPPSQTILHIKPFDYGLSAAVGYETGIGMFFHIAFEYGLTDITRSTFYSTDAKYRLFRFGAGYLLNRRR